MRANPVFGDTMRGAEADCLVRFSSFGIWRSRLRRRVQGGFQRLRVGVVSRAKRALDILAAFVLVLCAALALIPVLPLFWCAGFGLRRIPRVGRQGAVFDEYILAAPGTPGGRLIRKLRVHRLPTLFNILKGEMSFVGPRPVSPDAVSLRDRMTRKRSEVRPGLICLWWVRRRVNIAYGTEAMADGEYVDAHSIWGDVGIACRAVPAVFYGAEARGTQPRVKILGVEIDNLTMAGAVGRMIGWMEGQAPRQVCFVNADCANLAYRNPAYRRALGGAALRLADGIGLKLAGKVLNREIRQNVNGTDMFPRLCESLSGTGKGVFLLGARPGVAEGVREWIAGHYPRVRVCGCRQGYFSADEEAGVVREVAASGADLLMVALGAPHQDLWIARHLDRLGVKVAVGVGGLFDFYSGRIPRAPAWVREMGLEWAYRLCQEPGRMWKRYVVGNFLFLFRVIRERAGGGEGGAPEDAGETQRGDLEVGPGGWPESFSGPQSGGGPVRGELEQTAKGV